MRTLINVVGIVLAIVVGFFVGFSNDLAWRYVLDFFPQFVNQEMIQTYQQNLPGDLRCVVEAVSVVFILTLATLIATFMMSLPLRIFRIVFLHNEMTFKGLLKKLGICFGIFAGFLIYFMNQFFWEKMPNWVLENIYVVQYKASVPVLVQKPLEALLVALCVIVFAFIVILLFEILAKIVRMLTTSVHDRRKRQIARDDFAEPAWEEEKEDEEEEYTTVTSSKEAEEESDDDEVNEEEGPISKRVPKITIDRWKKFSSFIIFGVFLLLMWCSFYKTGVILSAILWPILTYAPIVTPPKKSYVFTLLGWPIWASKNGLGFIIPGLMKCEGVVNMRLFSASDNVATEEEDISKRRVRFRVVTSDNVPVRITATIIYRIFNPLIAFFAFETPETEVPAIMQSILAEECSSQDFLALQSNRKAIAENAIEAINAKLEETGFGAFRVAVDEPIASDDFQSALEKNRIAKLETNSLEQFQSLLPDGVDDADALKFIQSIQLAKEAAPNTTVFADSTLGKNGSNPIVDTILSIVKGVQMNQQLPTNSQAQIIPPSDSDTKQESDE